MVWDKTKPDPDIDLKTCNPDILANWAAIENTLGALNAPTELTIATGVITVSRFMHTVDTESDDPSDDLDTINGGVTGRMVILKAENDARTVVIKHSTGNIWLKGKVDLSLDDLEDGLALVYTGSKWIDIGAPSAALTSVAFQIRKTANQSNIAVSTDVTVIFDDEIFDIGGNFASNTFTAPVTGKYHFDISIRLNSIDTAASFYILALQTSNRVYSWLMDVSKFSADVFYWSFAFSVIADMDATDTAYVYVRQEGGTQQSEIESGNYTWFSGVLVA